MTVDKSTSLEDRIKNPAYLLFVIIVLIFLIIGFVNLLDHTSRNPVILGQFSLGTFLIVVLYGLATLAWASLLLRPNNDRWLRRLLDFVQFRPPIAIGVIILFVLIIGQFFYKSRRWLVFPALQALIIILVFLGGGLILFYHWGDKSRPQTWRKFIVYPLAVLLGIELILQGLGLFGLLPNFTQVTDSFAPFNRVYYTEEGFRNGAVNNYGFHYPQFRLMPNSRRILILGDTFIQALAVKPEENLGVLLENYLIGEGSDGPPIEVLGMGSPDFGPGLYLSPLMTGIANDAFAPQEAIAFFDLGTDFQTAASKDYVAYFVVDDNGEVAIHPDNWLDFHMVEHGVYRAYEKTQFVELAKTHIMTARMLGYYFNNSVENPIEVLPPGNDDINLPNAFVFNERTNNEAMTIATGLIKNGNAVLEENGIDFHLVTIPVFTDEFLGQEEWNTQFGESDLLLPEQELRQFASENGIPFLGLGAYMAAKGFSPADVKSLYFKDGRGQFTPAGHEFAAKAVFDCFYAGKLSNIEGCDTP